MGKINGYVSDHSVVRDIENAAKVDGVKLARWVGDSCILRLRNENRLSGGDKAKLQLIVGEAVDGGTNAKFLEDGIRSIIREWKRKEALNK